MTDVFLYFECRRKERVCAAELHPANTYLNTAVRPPADADVRPAAAERLQELAQWFTPRAEVVASFRATAREQTAARGAVVCEQHGASKFFRAPGA